MPSFEFTCSAPITQWWLVITRPSGDTKLAEHPPRLTTAPSGNSVGFVRTAGSIEKPTPLKVSAWSASCSGSHMPPGFSKGPFGVATGVEVVDVVVVTAVDVVSFGGCASGVGPQPRPRTVMPSSLSPRPTIQPAYRRRCVGSIGVERPRGDLP